MDTDQLLIELFQVKVAGGEAVPLLQCVDRFFEPLGDRLGEIIKGVPVEKLGKAVTVKEIYVVGGVIGIQQDRFGIETFDQQPPIIIAVGRRLGLVTVSFPRSFSQAVA